MKEWLISTISLAVREIQTKTTTKSHFIPARMAMIEKTSASVSKAITTLGLWYIDGEDIKQHSHFGKQLVVP